MKPEYITRKGYQKLCEDYDKIAQEVENTLKEMGESAKRDNDLRENSEYMDLRVKAMYVLPEQKRKMYERKQNAVIIEETDEYKNFDGTTVIIGSEVELIIDGEIEVYKILGDIESDPDNTIISWKTDLATTVLNKHVGETVELNNMKIIIKSVKKV